MKVWHLNIAILKGTVPWPLCLYSKSVNFEVLNAKPHPPNPIFNNSTRLRSLNIALKDDALVSHSTYTDHPYSICYYWHGSESRSWQLAQLLAVKLKQFGSNRWPFKTDMFSRTVVNFKIKPASTCSCLSQNVLQHFHVIW